MSSTPQPPFQPVAWHWNAAQCVTPNQGWQNESATGGAAATPAANFRVVFNGALGPQYLNNSSTPFLSGADCSLQMAAASSSHLMPGSAPVGSSPDMTSQNQTSKSVGYSAAHSAQHQFAVSAGIVTGSGNAGSSRRRTDSEDRSSTDMAPTQYQALATTPTHNVSAMNGDQGHSNTPHWLLDKPQPVYHTPEPTSQPRGMSSVSSGSAGGMRRGENGRSTHGYQGNIKNADPDHAVRSSHASGGNQLITPPGQQAFDPRRPVATANPSAIGIMAASEYGSTQPIYGIPGPSGGFTNRPMSLPPVTSPPYHGQMVPHQAGNICLPADRVFTPTSHPPLSQYTMEDGSGEPIFVGQLPGSPLRSRYLWLFLLRLLEDTRYSSFIAWTRRPELEFQLRQPEEVAALWGRVKRRTNMTYDKMSRAMRYYYRQNVLRKVRNKRYVYRFLRIPSLEQQSSALPLSCSMSTVANGDASPTLSVTPGVVKQPRTFAESDAERDEESDLEEETPAPSPSETAKQPIKPAPIGKVEEAVARSS